MVPVKGLTKEETVYVKLENNGKTNNIKVVDHLINNGSENIIDYTDLKNIENINGYEKFKLNENKLIWKTKKKDIYYKGISNNKLPIDLSIKYTLNGKEMIPEKMLGKEGHIEIILKYTNNSKKGDLYTPFVVATTTILDGTNNSNILVNNGKVISNGENYVIAGLSTPGLYESLGIAELKNMDMVTISYDTKRFELSSIYAVSTPKLVDSIDLSRLNNLDNIYQSIDTLTNSSQKLLEGAKAINEGTTKINQEVTNSIETLKNNQDTIGDDVLDTIKTSAQHKVSEEIETRKDEIESEAIQNLIEIENQTNQIKMASDAGIDSNETLIDAIKLETHKQMNLTEEEINQVKNACLDGIEDYCTQLGTIEAYENSAIESLKEAIYSNALELAKNVAASTAYNTSLKVANDVASKTSITVAQTVFDQVKTTVLNKMVLSLDELKKGLDTLNNGTKGLESGMNTFDNQGIKKISDIVNNKVRPNINKIKELQQLSHSYNTFTKISDDTAGSVKFIYSIDGLKYQQNKTKKEKLKKTTFVGRIKHLFD